MRNSIILFGFALFVTLVGCTRDRTRHLTVIIDESINDTPQWAYWYCMAGNECYFIDSCYLETGQKKLKLREYPVRGDSVNRTDVLVFSETLTSELFLYLDKDDLDIEIRTSQNSFYDSVFHCKGSQGVIELAGYMREKRLLNQKILELENHRDFGMYDNIGYKMIVDSIHKLTKYTSIELSLECFKKSKSANLSQSLLPSISKQVSLELGDSLILIMKQKFPNDYLVQSYGNWTPAKEASKESKLANARYVRIIKDKYVKSQLAQTDKNIPSINGSLAQQIKESQQKIFAKDSVQSRSYTLGDRVQGVELLGMNNKGISLDDIELKYILIDFWADWCAPCIREFAHVENVQTTYKDILTVYAISLDNNEAIWRTAIAKHNLELFTNVYAGNWLVDETKDFTNRFGIKSIPANFLLDKDRRIIAINLRGEALEKKMKELTK